MNPNYSADDVRIHDDSANFSDPALRPAKIKHRIDVEYYEDSNIVAHAKRELSLYGGIGYGDELDEQFNQQVLDIMIIFASQGHSGMSASLTQMIVASLMKFDNLAPLTDDPADWIEVGPHTWQNRRNSEAFSEDHGLTYRLLSESSWDDTLTWKSPFLALRKLFIFSSSARDDFQITEQVHTKGKLHHSQEKVAG